MFSLYLKIKSLLLLALDITLQANINYKLAWIPVDSSAEGSLHNSSTQYDYSVNYLLY